MEVAGPRTLSKCCGAFESFVELAEVLKLA
jgi:hypothetical protein